MTIVHIKKPLVKYRVGGISSWDKVDQNGKNIRLALRKKSILKMDLYTQKIKDLDFFGGPENAKLISLKELSYWKLIESASCFSILTVVHFYQALRLGVEASRCIKGLLSTMSPGFYSFLRRIKY